MKGKGSALGNHPYLKVKAPFIRMDPLESIFFDVKKDVEFDPMDVKRCFFIRMSIKVFATKKGILEIISLFYTIKRKKGDEICSFLRWLSRVY